MILDQPPIWLIIIAFIAAIGPLVFFHELGHYGVARLFKVPAESFSIGFGKEMFGWTDKRGTRWKVCRLPLGGYVKFAGDADAASSHGETGDSDPSHFQNRPVHERFLIVLAGPVANFILAIAIFTALFSIMGVAQTSTVVREVIEDSAAAEMGIEPGDRIASIEGQTTRQFDDITRIVALRPEETVEVVVERDEQQIVLSGQLGAVEEADKFGQVARIGRLGIGAADAQFDRLGPIAAAGEGVRRTVGFTRFIWDGVVQIVTGKRSVRDLGGPIKMAQISGQMWVLGLYSFIFLTAILSINLGFINLLPVPMLDGGHLLFYAIEAVKRSPVSERAQEWAFRGGLAVLLALFVFLTLNDLVSVGVVDRLERLIG